MAMKTAIFVGAAIAVLSGCGRPNQEVVDPKVEAQLLLEKQVESQRQSDPALNWVNIGIATGKFSESIHSSVHRTHADCAAASYMEDNTCFPIRALPDSYWNARPSND